jgi:hypothetical protein
MRASEPVRHLTSLMNAPPRCTFWRAAPGLPRRGMATRSTPRAPTRRRPWPRRSPGQRSPPWALDRSGRRCGRWRGPAWAHRPGCRSRRCGPTPRRRRNSRYAGRYRHNGVLRRVPGYAASRSEAHFAHRIAASRVGIIRAPRGQKGQGVPSRGCPDRLSQPAITTRSGFAPPTPGSEEPGREAAGLITFDHSWDVQPDARSPRAL